GGSSQQKNFPTVGSIPGGAIVEKDVPATFTNDGNIVLALNQPDFTTASRISDALDSRFGSVAYARDPGTVIVSVPPAYTNNVVDFVSALEELSVVPDEIAKVVVNERTGTVVMGSRVTIDEVAVAQGNLTVKITNNTTVSQPPPLSGGSTVAVNNTSVNVTEQPANLVVLPTAASVGDVVNALNAVGATPRDVIAILQAIKAAGALHAELQVM
ncbi:flagellar p-ring protein, partial [Lucifera butyrica]